ncbi:MAG: hypothetical protein H0W96_01980 [Solirubrobacterales bacterium]|nr:hypothetical protein [Solirubrobacterales bacterium]
MWLVLLALPAVAQAQQPTLSNSTLIGSFTTTQFRCFPTVFNYESSGELTATDTFSAAANPYYPGTFRQSGHVAGIFVARFEITTHSGTLVRGTAWGPVADGCSRGGGTNIFSVGATPSAVYEATITTADGRRFSDAGRAFASFVGQAPQERDLRGTSRLSFQSQFEEAVPIGDGAHVVLAKSGKLNPSASGASADYFYTLANHGSETLFHVSVQDTGCSPVTYFFGDVNGDQLLQPGEAWAFTCTRSYASPGPYSGTATAHGTSTQTGLPVASNPSRLTLRIAGGSPRALDLRTSADPPSGEAPLRVVFTYVLENAGTETLFHATVADEGCSRVIYGSGDTNGDQLLQPGETWTFTCSRTYDAAGTYSGQATARATSADTGFAVSSNTATMTVTVNNDAPDLELRATSSPDTGAAPLTVEHTYTLANRGSETLFHVSVAHESCSPVTYRSGDVNGDQLLQPGETWTFTCSRTYEGGGTYTGDATARGTSTQTGLPVSSNPTRTLVVVGGDDPPVVELRASPSPDSGPAPLAVDYTYTLVNRGSETLFHVSVAHDRCSAVTYRRGDVNGDQLLQPGETWTFTCSHTYDLPGQYSGEATARGVSTQTGLPVISNTALTMVTANPAV